MVAAGGLCGGYLAEFLQHNSDFVPQAALAPWQAAALVLGAGPAAALLAWLITSAIMTRLTDLRLDEALKRAAPAFWVGLLFGGSLLLSVLLGRPMSSIHAAVVLIGSSVFTGYLGVTAWEFSPYVRPAWRFRLSGPRPVIIGMSAFVAVAAVLVLLRYASYNYWGIDLGQFDQALWNTWHGRLLQFTQYGGLTDTLLTDHVEPIMLLIAPLYLLWPDPRALLLLQVVALAAGSWLAYRLAIALLGNRFAGALAGLAYLAHPVIFGNALDASGSFRPDLLTVPLFLGVLLALERRRWKLALFLCILAMACKEYIAALVVMLGLYVIYRYRKPRLGLLMAGLGVVWLVGVLGVFLPWVRGGAGSIHYQLNFGALGGDSGAVGIVSNLAQQPALLLGLVASGKDLLLWFFYLLSFAWLPAPGLSLLLVGIPIFGMFGVTGVLGFSDFHLAPAFPFAFGAALLGIGGLAGWAERRLKLPAVRVKSTLAVVLLAASVSAAFFWSGTPLGLGFWSSGRPYTYWRNYYAPDDHDRRADRFLATAPEAAPLIASDHLLLRLTQRPVVYHFYDPPPAGVLSGIDAAVIDLFETYVRPPESGLRQALDDPEVSATAPGDRPAGKELYAELLASGEFNLVAHEDGLLYFRRKGPGEQDGGYANSIEVVAAANPSVQVNYDFGQRLRLLGYDFEVDPEGLQPGKRYRIVYYWQVLAGFDASFTFRYGINPQDDVQQLARDYVLIDTFTRPGGDPFRVVHLPTYLLAPPDTWQPGQLLREAYDFSLPEDLAPGAYEWQVGLYAVPRYFPITISKERWVPGTVPFSLPDVEVTR